MDTSTRQYFNKYYTLLDSWATGKYSTILRKWVDTQLRQLDIAPTDDVMHDLATIQYLTNTKLSDAAEYFARFMYGNVDMCDIEPFVLPNIRNVLNERDTKLSNISNFTGKLYIPQATLLQRMLEIEEFANTFPALKGDTLNMDDLIRGLSKLGVDTAKSTYLIQSNIGIIKERISFGKTYIMPALFCANLIPRFKKIDINCRLGIKYEDGDCIHTNIVLCSTKVVKEWINNIKMNTSLTHAKISTAKDLNMLNIESLPQIILIKDGDITWNSRNQSALSHFLELFGTRIAARLIVDDYDMLKFKTDQKVPLAIFTWLISSTEDKSRENKCSIDTYGYYFSNAIYYVGGMLYSLKCNSDYSAVEFNIPKVEYYASADINSLIPTLVKGDIPERSGINIFTDALLTAKGDVPYVHGIHSLKIMLVINDKDEKNKYVKQLTDVGIRAAKLDRRNIHMFETNDLQVAICSVMCGVNLGCVSHVIIPYYYEYSDAQINQIIGRAQRISRKHNLQVYFIEEVEIKYSSDDDKACDIEYKMHP